MAHRRGRSTSPQPSTSAQSPHPGSEDDSLISSRQLEAFGRTVHATATHLINANFPTHDAPGGTSNPYRTALSSVHQLSQRPMIQRSVFSLAKANPRELIRSKFVATEIEHRALAYLPDELLRNVPESHSPFSLFEGFKASLPPDDDLFGPRHGLSSSSSSSSSSSNRKRQHHRRISRGPGLLSGSDGKEEDGTASPPPPKLAHARRERDRLEHGLEMMGVRKSMFAAEIREIDEKVANLSTMRKVVLDRLAGLEDEERELEQQVSEASERVDTMEEEVEEAAAAAAATAAASSQRAAADAAVHATKEASPESEGDDASAAGFMSESIYGKLPKNKDSTKGRRKRNPRRITTPVLHEHMESGSQIREVHAHNDIVTALDFDAPFGTLVTAALDDTIRVWDLNAARCVGFLEGHLSSVRCLQVEQNLVATGSMDASIRLWDLNQADYHPPAAAGGNIHSKEVMSEEGEASATGEELFTPTSESGRSPVTTEYRSNAMVDCHLFTLSAHVAEVTALNFHGSTLVSGSADKTLRQWDLEMGRCVQTLDVLWAAAQASTIGPSANSGSGVIPSPGLDSGGWWRPTGGRLQSAEADFVGAVQVFDAALACGTADGMVRLWDLRSGMVHRSLVGHTGPVTALQFDDVYLVTGSQDRSIRIWDLRTGNIHDAFAYDNPITSMQFDARRIVTAAGEDVVKVYDKTDGRQWDCGAGAAADTSEPKSSIVERVRIKDGYLVEGRRDGVVGVWSC